MGVAPVVFLSQESSVATHTSLTKHGLTLYEPTRTVGKVL